MRQIIIHPKRDMHNYL